MDILDQAIVFAVNAHSGMRRKGTQNPYILHPLEAAAIVATMTADREVIAAAVLHDVVEDTDTTIEMIRQQFGERVAELVDAESENKRENLPAESTWKLRKQETLDHLSAVTDPAVKMITLGDKLSNMRSIYRDYQTLGDKLWDRFNQKDPREHCWYYSEVCNALQELSDTFAWKECRELIQRTFGDQA